LLPEHLEGGGGGLDSNSIATMNTAGIGDMGDMGGMNVHSQPGRGSPPSGLGNANANAGIGIGSHSGSGSRIGSPNAAVGSQPNTTGKSESMIGGTISLYWWCLFSCGVVH